MTSENGSSAYGMAPELIAERREQPVREGVVTPRAEAREQRRRDRGQRHGFLDGVLDRPAPFAGVLDVVLQTLEPGVVRQCRRGELRPPRADDGALIPELVDLRQVESVLRGRHQLDAFGVALHHRVLDAVVNHLHVVPGAHTADVQPAVRRRECREDRREAIDGALVAADHQTVAILQAPDAAARSRIDIVQAAGRELTATSDVVRPLRVAAVDDRVAAHPAEADEPEFHQDVLPAGSNAAAARSRIQSSRPSVGRTIAAGTAPPRSPSAALTTLAFSAPDTR